MARLQDRWYQPESVDDWSVRLLKPLAAVVKTVARRRYRDFTANPAAQDKPRCPVIVVGNITVGGTGKTPVVIYLIELLRRQGFTPGVVSRGYGGKAGHYPMRVTADSLGSEAGDEPLLIASRTGCPVVVDPNRTQAISALLSQTDCDIVISDDGLQHFAMARDLDIVVVDGHRGLGNQLCLPAGPLREPVERLADVDFILHNSTEATLPTAANGVAQAVFTLQPGDAINCFDHSRRGVKTLAELGDIAAIAGIGHPQRFFSMLTTLGLSTTNTGYADHYAYSAQDLADKHEPVIVMTEKDAVKCRDFADRRCWYIPIEAIFPPSFDRQLIDAINRITSLTSAQ
ncbi:Tetraacyldisaccharide 4'-kinase [Sinobacterium norvegicum]|uniref:Tetraacyldisaccharide 4'-kinase n=1 Tax=Sinobacterium norvegicum TaxID=1641715 RepID=A0ABN8EBY7_9GAMM|nr:tetraacyldisaccharide 4'-kinase [Sinobacterium norvegicum]CAH0990005.1 Tetraacyldisaccharide 4'-kinase [Sinobacterium norvegicum]